MSKKKKRVECYWFGVEYKSDGSVMAGSIWGSRERSIRFAVGGFLDRDCEFTEINEIMGHWEYRRKAAGLRVIGISLRGFAVGEKKHVFKKSKSKKRK